MSKKSKLTWLILFTTVVSISWYDSNGDKTKSVLVVEYSNGTVDNIVVDKAQLNDSNVSKIVDQANKVMDLKEGKNGH